MMGMGIKRMVKFLKDTGPRGHYSIREERTADSADITTIMRKNDDLHTHTAGAQGCERLQIVAFFFHPLLLFQSHELALLRRLLILMQGSLQYSY